MRTNDMIYQAAVAHQTDLRRTASRHSAAADRSSGRASWISRFAAARAQREQRPAATAPAPVLTRHVSA